MLSGGILVLGVGRRHWSTRIHFRGFSLQPRGVASNRGGDAWLVRALKEA